MTSMTSERPLMTIPRVCVVFALMLLCAVQVPLAQSRPPAAATPADAALKALNVGQYDEVERLLRSATDARSVAIRARADIERGRYAEAEKTLTPVASAQPGSDAALELGLLQMQLGRRNDAVRTLKLIVARVRRRRRLLRTCVLVWRRARWAVSRRQRDSSVPRIALAPTDVAVNTAWGELFLEKYNRKEAMRVVSGRAEGGREPRAGHSWRGPRRWRRRTRPRRSRRSNAPSRSIPNSVPAHLLAAEIVARRPQARRCSRQRSQRSAGGQSEQPRSALARGGDRVPRRQDHRRSTRRSQTILKINPVYGEVYRVAGDHARAQLPLRRGRRPGAARGRASTRRTRGRTPISACTCCAPATSPARAWRSSAPSRTIRYDVVTLQPAVDDRLARQVRDHPRRRRHRAPASRRSGGDARVRVPLAKEAIATLSKQYDSSRRDRSSIEMFPKHDDFAVRTMGLPGMIGALGACFGRVVTLDSPKARPPGDVQLGRDAVARAGARHHAADVEQPRAAVADGRHLGVRREARASRVGPRDRTSPSRRRSTRARS